MVNIILGALSGYQKLNVAAYQALEAAEASAAKKIKFNLDDLDLSAGSIFSDSRTLNIGGDSKLDSLRNTCISIVQLGLETEGLIDLFMAEGPDAAAEVIRERGHPQYCDENHLTTWVKEIQIKNPATWDMNPKIATLQELENLLSYELIDHNALKANDNE